MNASLNRVASATFALVLSAAGASAQSVAIDWAGSSSAAGTASILNAPDGAVVTLGTGGTTLAAFGGQTSHSLGGLAALLGINASLLGPNQVIGFEYNGGGAPAGGAWESSVWTFNDGSNTRTAMFDELTGLLDPGSSPDVLLVASGTFASSGAGGYSAFFGFAPSLPDSRVSFVIFQLLTSIDATNPAFNIHVAGASIAGHQGTPDPDAIGVIRSVPTPGAAALMGLGGLAVAGGRRRR